MKTYVLAILTVIVSFYISEISYASGVVYPNDSLKKQMYRAYLINSLSVWKTIEGKKSKAYKQNPNNMQVLLELSQVQYGLLYCCLTNQAEDTFEEYIDEAKHNVEQLLEANNDWAKAHALKAGLLNVDMGFNPAKGMFLGSKGDKHIEKAIAIDKNEPTAWIQKGSAKFHTPKMFGGSIKMAIKCYKKAIQLYENDSAACKNNWQYINALAWLGKAYTKDENYNKAREIYKKALRIELDFYWVKHVLMKNLKTKIANQ